MFVKFCGFTKIEDLKMVPEDKIDAVGFIFYKKSSRYISKEQAKILSGEAKNMKLKTVGIFVDTPVPEIKKIADYSNLDYLQLYDFESVEKLRNYKPMFIASRIKAPEELDALPELYKNDYYLLDSYCENSYGGCGKTFPWSYLENFKFINRTIVAGGINSENIKDLLSKINPFGVDLSSSIEIKPGIKSYEKMNDFLIKLKEAENV